MTLPDFNRLRVFHQVYLHRSIQKAAEQLHVTRSAVSQAVKALEEEMGVQLFVRDPRSVATTPAADHLAAVIAPFIANLQGALNLIQRGKLEPFGRLRIGVPMEFGSTRMVQMASQFQAKHPDVSFDIQIGVPPKLLSAVCKGDLDLAFVDNADQFQGSFAVVCEEIARETFILVGSRKYHRRHLGSSCGFEDLSQCRFVGYLPHLPVARMWFQHHFGRVPAHMECSLAIESVRGVLNAVKAHMGLGVLPQELIGSELESAFVVVEKKKQPFINIISTAYFANRELTLTDRAFMEFARQQLAT